MSCFSQKSRAFRTYITQIVCLTDVPAIKRPRRTGLNRHDRIVNVPLNVEAVLGVEGDECGILQPRLEERQREIGGRVEVQG